MERELSILIVDDSQTNAEMSERVLAAAHVRFYSYRADGRESFVRMVKDHKPDVILLEIRLPHFDALEAMKLAKELCPAVPVIIVTGALRDEAAAALLREGAYDYILKDRLSRLPTAVEHAIKASRAEAERRAVERLLRDQADELRRIERAAADREKRLHELKARLQKVTAGFATAA